MTSSSLRSSSNGHWGHRGRRHGRRRGRVDARSALHLDVASAVTGAGAGPFLSVDLVLLTAAVGRWDGRLFGTGIGSLLLRSSPSGNLPGDPSEAPKLEAALGPFAARLSRAIEGAQASIDGTLVGFGSEFVSSCRSAGSGVIDSTVLTIDSCQHGDLAVIGNEIGDTTGAPRV